MIPRTLDLETRIELIVAHTREAVQSEWGDAYTRRCLSAILRLPDGTDLRALECPDEDREIGDGPTAELDGLTDREIVGMIIAYHWE